MKADYFDRGLALFFGVLAVIQIFWGDWHIGILDTLICILYIRLALLEA